MSFAFLWYSCREEAVRLACSSLLIRSSSIVLIGHILAFIGSVFSSAYIRGLRCSSRSIAWVYNELFTAIWLFRSYLRLIRASAQLVAPGLYIIMKLN